MQSASAPGRIRPGVFVYLACTLSLFAPAVHAQTERFCFPQTDELHSAYLDEVVDGDTLRLKDGRKVRLVGINAPELGRDGRPDQALARRSQRVASEWLGSGPIHLHIGVEARDRYGRQLATVFRTDGYMLGEHLLRQGLAWQVTVPPNTRYSECLQRAEQVARSALRGVWAEQRYPLLKAKSLTSGDTGFQRVRGRVSDIGKSRRALWLELDNGLSLRLSRDDRVHFNSVSLEALNLEPFNLEPLNPEALAGKVLTVRGWLIYRGKQKQGHPAHLMHLRHPAMLEAIEE